MILNVIPGVVLQSLSSGWHYTSLFGLIVGWLLMTYGVVIWGSNSYSHIPSRYGLMYASFGFALMLLNNRVLVDDPVTVMFVKFLGNLTIALAATIAFMWLRHQQDALSDVRDPDAHG